MGASDLNGSVEDQVAVAVALEDQESPERLAIINDLRRRADADTFRVLRQCVRADDPAQQAFALEVLGQFGYEHGRPWLALTLPVVTAATATSGPAELEAAILALGQLGDHRSLPTVLRYVGHHDPAIRFAVASALPKVGGDPFDPVAADGLIELMGDEDAEVRDWATFGLGVQTDVDSPAVRRALTERLDDPGADTSGEALVGLARRRDFSIVPRLLAELARPDVGNLEVEAAGELGDPRLLPALKSLKESDGLNATYAGRYSTRPSALARRTDEPERASALRPGRIRDTGTPAERPLDRGYPRRKLTDMVISPWLPRIFISSRSVSPRISTSCSRPRPNTRRGP